MKLYSIIIKKKIMKKILLTVCAMVALSMNSFAQSVADKVEGEYSGDLDVSLISAEDPTEISPLPTSASKIIIEKVTDTSVILKLNNLILGGEMFVGNVVLENIDLDDTTPIAINAKRDIEITAGDPDFEIDGEVVDENAWIGPAVTLACGGTIPVDLESTVTTIDADDSLKVKINIDISAALGYNVAVAFKGAKPTTVTSVGVEKSSETIKVYMNSNEELVVLGLNEETSYVIYNITGTPVKQGNTSGIVSTSSLHKGIYLIKVNQTTLKFVKK